MALSAKDAERVEGYLVLHNREMFENSFGVKDELTEEERTELEDLKAWLNTGPHDPMEGHKIKEISELLAEENERLTKRAKELRRRY